MLSNIVPWMDTINNKMDGLVTKEVNNNTSIRNLEVQMELAQTFHIINKGMLPCNNEVNLKKKAR